MSYIHKYPELDKGLSRAVMEHATSGVAAGYTNHYATEDVKWF